MRTLVFILAMMVGCGEQKETYVRTEGAYPISENWRITDEYGVGEKWYTKREFRRADGVTEIRWYVRDGLNTRPMGKHEKVPRNP